MQLTIERLHVAADSKVEKYAIDKIGKLDKYVPRHAKKTAHAQIRLKGGHGKGKKQFVCEVTMHLPHENITTTQDGISLNAAIDLAEDKLKNQLKKYKDKHVISPRHKIQRLFRRTRR